MTKKPKKNQKLSLNDPHGVSRLTFLFDFVEKKSSMNV